MVNRSGTALRRDPRVGARTLHPRRLLGGGAPRGLPFWFSLVTNGVSAYESAVQAGIDLAGRTVTMIEEMDHVELVRESSLSIVLYRRLGWSPDRYNAWSQQLLRDQIAFVTPTKWEGETVARLAFLHPDTSDDLVRQILESMRD